MPRRPSAAASPRRPLLPAPVFAALGDTTRLSLVSALSARGPLSLSRLTSGTRLTRQAVTKHLRLLEGAGLVRAERRGRERLFELAPDGLSEARRCLDTISAHWDAALLRLKDFVER